MVAASDEMLVVIALPKTVNATTNSSNHERGGYCVLRELQAFSSLKNRLIMCVLLVQKTVSGAPLRVTAGRAHQSFSRTR